MPPLLRSQFARRTLPITVFAFAAALAMQAMGWLAPLDNLYYDSWHLFTGKRFESRHSALAIVDDETLTELKDDPLAFWQPHFAKAMDTLTKAGVKAIGLDFIYTVSAESWLHKLNLPDSDISRNYDAPFRAQMAAGNKILIVYMKELPSGELEPLLPPPEHLMLLPKGIGDLGVANLYPDQEDKVVRHFYPVVIPDPQFPGIGFSTQLAFRGAGVDPAADAWDVAGEHYTRERKSRTIGFLGPPGVIPKVSMAKLLKPDALSDPAVQALKDRVVIITDDNASSSDLHFTPYSRRLFGLGGEWMKGGELHAHIIETILSGRYPRPLADWMRHAAALLAIGLCTVVFLRLHPAKGAVFAMAAMLVSLVPAYLLFLDNRLIQMGPIHAGIAVALLTTLGLRLTGEERKRRQASALFGQYVSDVVVERLLRDDVIPKLGGETVEVTVLFSDIRNFTTISEKLDAQEVVEMLNAYFGRACEPILANGGMVNKFIGDAIMAVFGSPVHYPDHARRALTAAVEIARIADEFKAWMDERFPGRDLPSFGIGIGVHSGKAVLGDIGSTKRREFTAIGDTVNTASRLESATKEFGCVLVASRETVNQAGAGVDTGKTDSIHVKGKAEPVEVVEVRGIKTPGAEGA